MSNESEVNIFQETYEHLNGFITICGTAELHITNAGRHVRNTNLKLPFFEASPTISVQVFSLDKPKFFDFFNQRNESFAVKGVEFKEQQTYLGCKISVANIWKAEDSNRRYICNYVVQGKPK